MPQTVADLIAAWTPLIVVLAIVIYFMRSGGLRARGPSGRRSNCMSFNSRS
jgi:hypothetical protein